MGRQVVDRTSSVPGYRIEPLASNHERAAFSCGVPELDNYIRRQAGQDLKRKLAAVFVLAADDQAIAGFYTLSARSILASELPPEVGKKLPRYPLPVTLLGRMAVARSLQGTGLGKLLLFDALDRALRGSHQVGSWAVVVDTKAGARDFYLNHDFLPIPDRPDRLVMPMKAIERMFESS
jgi:GNAT superfamily N-acetyltransferase